MNDMAQGPEPRDTPETDDWVPAPEVTASLTELVSGAPRSAAILAGSLLDQALEQLLGSELPFMSEQRDVDYSGKCQALLTAGVLGERMYDELRALGRIRNEFAHSPALDLDFDSPEVAKHVRRLRGPRVVAEWRGVRRASPGSSSALEHLMPLGVTGLRYWWVIATLSALAVLSHRAGGGTSLDAALLSGSTREPT